MSRHRSRMPGGRALLTRIFADLFGPPPPPPEPPRVRRVLGAWFGPVEPPPTSRVDVDERIVFMADSLATCLALVADSGFAEMDSWERTEIARRIAFERYRVESGRLSEAEEVRS